MIDLYTWTTPNGRKVSVMLEECDLDYVAHPINLGKEEQFSDGFLRISPNNKIPAIIDNDAEGGPVSVFESGAILIYLAEKTGQYLPTNASGRANTLQWLMWQMGGFGPMLGQLYHFTQNAEKAGPYGVERFTAEAKRLYGVLEKQLGQSEFVAGDVSIADFAIYPWSKPVLPLLKAMLKQDFPNVERWTATMDARPATGRGMQVPAV